MHKSPLTKYYYPHFTDKISEGSERLSNIPKAAQLLSGPAEMLNLPPPPAPPPPCSCPPTLNCQLPHNPSSKAPPQWALGGPPLPKGVPHTAPLPTDYSFQILYYFPPPNSKGSR